ncbi:MAG TPA: hypothetical protein VJA20_02695 [Candidatus Nanoarchaeia archaeon]|nr:hypothetical protein [Candidatus Nanoarchaeia archaeon]
MVKKIFFKEATIKEIKKKNKVKINFLYEISHLKQNEYTIINSFIPKNYQNSRKFMKHGLEVKPMRYYSLEHALKIEKTPVQLREEAFNKINSYEFCGYSFMPLGKDKRKRKVSLIECLEGARIFAYSHQKKSPIKIKSYDDAKRVKKEGAEIIAEVSSRTKKERKNKFKLVSVPVKDSLEKYAVSLNIGSDHSCLSKRFNIRYRYNDDKESSGIVNICAHEIAAYLELIQQELDKKKNIVPVQMCQFAIPTQETVNYYLKLENNVLIYDKNLKNKNKLRKPNRAEKEISLWALVKFLEYDKTFYSKKSRDGDVADYTWIS